MSEEEEEFEQGVEEGGNDYDGEEGDDQGEGDEQEEDGEEQEEEEEVDAEERDADQEQEEDEEEKEDDEEQEEEKKETEEVLPTIPLFLVQQNLSAFAPFASDPLRYAYSKIALDFQNVFTLHGEALAAHGQLQYLSAIGNKIESIYPLRTLTQLKSISVQQNRIATIPGPNDKKTPFPALPLLQLLELDDNLLEALPVFPHPRLQVLSAARNRITSLKGFGASPALRKLVINENEGLESLEGVVGTLDGLTELQASNTQMISLQGLDSFPNLTSLDVSNNDLQETLVPLNACKQLTRLNLAENKTGLVTLLKGVQLPNLTHLNIDDSGDYDEDEVGTFFAQITRRFPSLLVLNERTMKEWHTENLPVYFTPFEPPEEEEEEEKEEEEEEEKAEEEEQGKLAEEQEEEQVEEVEVEAGTYEGGEEEEEEQGGEDEEGELEQQDEAGEENDGSEDEGEEDTV